MPRFCLLGDFRLRHENTRCAVFRSGARVALQSPVEEISLARCYLLLCYGALSEWHLGEIAFCRATMAEAISLAKELNDMARISR